MTCIVRSVGQLLVNRFERCGVNMHDRFAEAVVNDRLREFFVSGRCSNRVKNGSIHNEFFLSTCSIHEFYKQIARVMSWEYEATRMLLRGSSKIARDERSERRKPIERV